MGNARSKKDFEPYVPVPGAEMVLTVFYDVPAWSDVGYIEALKSLGYDYDPEWPMDPSGDNVAGLAKDGAEFNFMWGTGLGRYSLRPRIAAAYHNVGVVVIFVSFEFIKGDYRHVCEDQLLELLNKELKDVDVLVVVSPAPEGENPPMKEMIQETKGVFKICTQKCEFVPSRETKAATMDHAITTVAAWIKQRKEKKEEDQARAAEFKASLALLPKLKLLAKSFPKKCYAQ